MFWLLNRGCLKATCVACVTLVASCKDNYPLDTESETQQLSILASLSGLELPLGVELMGYGDGGGRDSNYGYYEWAFFSVSPFNMPRMNAEGVGDYLSLPLEGSVKLLESRMAGRQIVQPQVALSSHWHANGFDFRGNLVRSASGDYVLIQRFRSK